MKRKQKVFYYSSDKIQEIVEITGYNEEKQDMEYHYIYKREAEC